MLRGFVCLGNSSKVLPEILFLLVDFWGIPPSTPKSCRVRPPELQGQVDTFVRQ